MKPFAPRVIFATVAFAASAAAALAHPGHDGGHELTWDMGHLADHPAATLVWATMLTAAAWGGARVVGALSARAQSLRVSADKRGK